jgi:hypothetical protein
LFRQWVADVGGAVNFVPGSVAANQPGRDIVAIG